MVKKLKQIEHLTGKGYGKLDPEMPKLIKLLNKVAGLRTVDCCFGHPERKRYGNQVHIYVGLYAEDENLFADFFSFVLKHTCSGFGMIYLHKNPGTPKNLGFSIELHKRLYPSEDQFEYQLVIIPFASYMRRHQKLKGIEFLCMLIKEYLKLGPAAAKVKLVDYAEVVRLSSLGFNPGLYSGKRWMPNRQYRREVLGHKF